MVDNKAALFMAGALTALTVSEVVAEDRTSKCVPIQIETSSQFTTQITTPKDGVVEVLKIMDRPKVEAVSRPQGAWLNRLDLKDFAIRHPQIINPLPKGHPYVWYVRR